MNIKNNRTMRNIKYRGIERERPSQIYQHNWGIEGTNNDIEFVFWSSDKSYVADAEANKPYENYYVVCKWNVKYKKPSK